jgi:hypothetical protein
MLDYTEENPWACFKYDLVVAGEMLIGSVYTCFSAYR